MSDALCGPSNPLQQFKQQTQLDRTLQQDRLASRHAPHQGFRSQNGNAGVLDPEFEAFQAGVPTELPQFQPFHHPAPLSGPAQATPSWAADFQRMHISPPPVFQPQQLSQAGPANWAQGFQQHIAQSAPRAQTSAHTPQAFQQMARFGVGAGGFQSSFAQPSFAAPTMQLGKGKAVEQFDESAFAAAFDQAREDMMMYAEQETKAEPVLGDNATATAVDIEFQAGPEAMGAMKGRQRRLSQEMQMATKHLENLSPSGTFEQLDDVPILEDDIRILAEEEHQTEQQQQDNDNDALAQTAQELLEKIQHNQTEKFRNSQFLHLMRKLRDREVKVEGDQMVETASTAATQATTETLTNAPYDPDALATTLPRPMHALNNGPLGATHAATQQPPSNASGIPHAEQDHDAGRGINPADGQEVVDFLRAGGGEAGDDVGTFPSSYLHDDAASVAMPAGVYYGDLRPVTREGR